MSLIFHIGNINGGLVTGHEPEWERRRNKGSYNKGLDFFSVHWEAKDEYPNQIRLHVESPPFAIDSDLNKLKQEVIAIIRTLNMEKSVRESGYGYEDGSRLSPSNILENKSTEVFRVIVSKAQSEMTHHEKIEQVHTRLGEQISYVVNKFSVKLEIEFG